MLQHSPVYNAALAIKNAIDANPLSRKKTKELSSQVYASRNRLLFYFKLITASTIRRYRMEKRMEAASLLLLKNEMNIKQVASECGYMSTNNFSRDFKDVFYLTPEEWIRNKLKNNKPR